ncbi:MAG: NUDIX hydrolase [Candidatus Nanopelagicales bacterium]
MIEAAGVVLIREDAVPKVLLIHRGYRNDWSLPKGKLDSGELAANAAVRETLEETGYLVQLKVALTPVSYQVKDDAKTVYYWSATELAHDPTVVPNDEVDELRWVTIDEAAELLSYPRDLVTVSEALALQTGGIRTAAIVRHAISTTRESFTGSNDLDRPLAEAGFAQLTTISTLLAAYGITDLISSPALRCTQTLANYAAQEELKIAENPLLLEDNLDFTISEWHGLVRRNGVAICTHRPVIDQLADFEPDAAQLLRDLPPGGVVVLSWNHQDELVAAERHEI